MKLVGSYTSPFVRKLSILLLEKGITFEFINELPYNADKRAGVATDEFHAESFVRGKISVWPGDGKKGRKC